MRPLPTRSDVANWLARQAVTETAARTGFFLIPAALILGITLFFADPTTALLFPVLAFAAAIVLAGRLAGTSTTAMLAQAALLVIAGFGLAGFEMHRTTTTMFAGEATVRIDGTVLWRDRDAKGRFRYLVEIEDTDRPHLSRQPEKAQILVSSHHTPIEIGGRYRGLVRLRTPSGPAYPGGYDFAFGNYFAGLGATGFALGPPDTVASMDTEARGARGNGVPSLEQRVLRLRLSVSERIRDTIGGAEGAVATALITGDRAGIPDDVESWLRTTGLSHVLSISGLHMALVAGFAMAIVRGLLAAIPWCALRLPVKKIAAVAALAVASFYLILSGSNVASDRSFIMLSIVLLAVLFDRPALTLRNVAVAAIIVLALEPHSLMTASFQMSFSATAALVGVYGGFSRWRATREGNRRHGGWPGKTAMFLFGLGAASLIAGMATAPYAAYHFQRIAPYGLFANLVAVPLFSFWIMPLALVAMLAMPFGLDGPFLILMGHGLTAVFAVAHFLHDHLPDAPTGIMTPVGFLLLTVALVTFCFLSSRLRWAGLPLAVCGLLISPDRSERPDLLVFEDGKEVAMIDASQALVSRRERPNPFVHGQWARAFPENVAATRDGSHQASGPTFQCEVVGEAQTLVEPLAQGVAVVRDNAASIAVGPSAQLPEPQPGRPKSKPAKPRQKPMTFCHATTRNGIKVTWTDDYRQTGRACDEGNIAIVARAIRLDTCRSGAMLITLRTLRRSGSLAVYGTSNAAEPHVVASIGPTPEAWNRHRLAPWPEAWRKPTAPTPGAGGAEPPDAKIEAVKTDDD